MIAALVACVVAHAWLSAALAGAWHGFGGAILVDWRASRAWNRWHDALVYDWGIASFRWAQGALGGAVFALATAGVVDLTTTMALLLWRLF